jgi:adenosine kinase
MAEHVVCGSIAQDRILLSNALFEEQVLPEHLSRLSVSFLVPSLRLSWGGTGANIAYALAQMGEHPHLIGAIGAPEAPELLQRWAALGVDSRGIRVVENTFTAQATVLTDRNHNQITGFHPGAMAESVHTDVLVAVPEGQSMPWTIVAPDDPAAMRRHVSRLQAAGRPYLFDPGQAMPLLTAEALQQAVVGAQALLVNDYEARLLAEITGRPIEAWAAELTAKGGALFVTQGARGCDVWTVQGCVRVPAAKPEAVVDPTGCGDAFRAGLLFSLARRWGWVRGAEVGAVLAAVQVAHPGAQAYTCNAQDILAQVRAQFGPDPGVTRPRPRSPSP